MQATAISIWRSWRASPWKKWLVSYADVALNGSKRTLRDYSPEIDKNLIIHCYQPQPGYCACVLVPEEA